MFSTRRRAVPSWVALLAMLEDFVDTWDGPGCSPRRRADEVYALGGWRCFGPGCTARSSLEDHHLQYLSQGGDPLDLGNRICLCGFHHRQGEHGQLARCRGRAPLDVEWWLGREDVSVKYRNERRLARPEASDHGEPLAQPG